MAKGKGTGLPSPFLCLIEFDKGPIRLGIGKKRPRKVEVIIASD